MSKSNKPSDSVFGRLRIHQVFSFEKKSSQPSANKEVSTLAQQDMPFAGLPSRRSSNSFSTLDQKRERVAQTQVQASRQNSHEEARGYTPPATLNPASLQSSRVYTLTVAAENRAQMQAHGEQSSDFGPYEDHNINDRRRLPFRIQHGLLFTICITLEGAIFDHTKRWAPEFLADRRLSCAQEVELSFWDRFSLAPIIPVEAFAERDKIPRYHALLDRFREVRHTFVHRKKPPVMYVDRMLADSIELTKMIGDEPRTEKLDGIYQVIHHTGSLLRSQVTTESKVILEDRLHDNRQAQEMPMGWLEASRLQEEELEIMRSLGQNTERYETLYANALEALKEMMQPVSTFLVG